MKVLFESNLTIEEVAEKMMHISLTAKEDICGIYRYTNLFVGSFRYDTSEQRIIVDEDFEIVWADNIKSAIDLLEYDQPQNYDGLFIQRRDTALLRAAIELL